MTLDDNVPLKEQPDEFAVREPDPKELIGFLKAMEFGSIARRVAAHFEIEDIDASPRRRRWPMRRAEDRIAQSRRRPSRCRALRAPIDHDAYVTVTAAKDLDAGWRAREQGPGLRRHRNHLARSHAGGPVRRVSGGQSRARLVTSPPAIAAAMGLNFDFSDKGDGNEAIVQLPEAAGAEEAEAAAGG